MKTLKCIVADDEPIARQILEKYITEVPYLNMVASCTNAFEVLEVLQHKTADVLFLDINMPKLSGLSLLKSMQLKTSVIITTAYPEYAVEGFELSVTDYLLKPFSIERFLKAVSKVQQQPSTRIPIAPSATSEADTSKALFVKSDKKIIKIEISKINHIEAYGNYIKIFNDAMVLTPQTLTDFLEKLPSNFMRIHKSFVINFDRLKLIDGNQITLHNGTKLPIGKSYRKTVLDRI